MKVRFTTMKRVYIKDRKLFFSLLIVLFVIINLILIGIYGVNTVALYGFLLTLFLGGGLVGILILFLTIVSVVYLLKNAIGIKE